MRTRIGTQMILGAGAVMALAIGLTAIVTIRSHQAEMITQLTRSADQLGETIASSAHDYMLENHREKLHRQILAIGDQEGIDRIRIFNKEGRIMLSTDSGELGSSLDKNAEACFVCHAKDRPLQRPPTPARSRVFTGAGGERLVGIVNPIPNEPGCWQAACHAHSRDESVLGVLDVTVSLASADQSLARSQVRVILIAILAVAASSLILWWLNRRLVLAPVRALTAGTRRVAGGDLSTTIRVTAGHELGDLARAFNKMIVNMADARRQITQAEKLASVGRLAAGVAHEINNPLTGVLTYSSLLLKRASDPDLRKDLEVIVRETVRCRDIVKDLLDFARQTPPQRTPTDVNEVARRAVAVVMNQLSLNRVGLTLDLTSDLPRVPADANQIQQVIVNLLLNAADAIGSSGGGIRLSTRHVDRLAWEHERIRDATCSRGCSLPDPSVRIGGMPAMRVARRQWGQEVIVHLDPTYGMSRHLASSSCEEGIVSTYHCPRCQVSLMTPDRSCDRCGAGAFGVLAGENDPVLWCARKGCSWSLWKSREEAGAHPFVEIAVEDTGCGIPLEDQQHLFEPFFSTKGRRGTGLGLAVTWGIVESHGGTIEVASDPGAGSRFIILLPLSPADAGSPEGREEPVAAGAAHD